MNLPMEESFTPEHSSELLGDALKQLLDGGGIADERSGHLQATGRDVAHSSLDVVGDPFNEVAAVLVLHVQHLLIYLLHREGLKWLMLKCLHNIGAYMNFLHYLD